MKINLGFEDKIDQWVLEAVNSGIKTFDGLILTLPGVYPSLVMKSINRLTLKNKLKNSILKNSIRYVKQKEKHHIVKKDEYFIPHPLDYHWKFNQKTINNLLNLAYDLTKRNDTIILLGIPSVFHNSVKKLNERKVILIDKNNSHFKGKQKNSLFFNLDLFKDKLPRLKANLIVADPPWYEEHYRSFIWAASRFCSMNGHLLLSIPPLGTRDVVEKEITQIYRWTKRAGFEPKVFEKKFLTYISPLFERNALRKEGICKIPSEWRKADLAIFVKAKNLSLKRSVPIPKEEWESFMLSGIEIRVRKNKLLRFFDPSLISLVDDDILPTTSRRDGRRKNVQVWTVGNRIFDCKGTNILAIILKALSDNQPPHSYACKFLKRELTKKEYSRITKTVNQLFELIEIERNEMGGSIGR